MTMTTILLLIVIGMSLIILNFRAIKKDKNSFNRVLINSEENMKDFEVEIGKFRREFSETILELQQEIEALKDRLDEKSKETYVMDSTQVENLQNLVNDIKILSKDKMAKNVEEKIVEEIKQDIKEDIKEKVEEKFEEKYKENEDVEDKDSVVNKDGINEMFNNGLSVDEVAEKTGLGKGEVLLIKDLYKK